MAGNSMAAVQNVEQPFFGAKYLFLHSSSVLLTGHMISCYTVSERRVTSMFVRMYVSRAFSQMTAYEKQENTRLEHAMIETFGGFTVISGAHGYWKDLEGEIHSDIVDVYDIMVSEDMPRGILRAFMIDFAIKFGKIHGQQCIPFTMMDSTNVFNEVNPDPNV